MTAPAAPLPNPKMLTVDQERGLDCALCGRRLFADRSLGIFRITRCGHTEEFELWACAPTCETAKRPLGQRS